jgi:hypothetical protein
MIPMQDPSALESQLRQLSDACKLAASSAETLLSQSPHQPMLAYAYAKKFSAHWGQDITNCVVTSMQRVSRYIEEACAGSLLSLAKTMDLHAASAHASTPASSVVPCEMSAPFHTELTKLIQSCCSTPPETKNLLHSVQSFVPFLARLSSQIDTDALSEQAKTVDLPQTAVLAHVTQLANLTRFNLHVYRVVTCTQTVVNMMSDWQDCLRALADLSSKAVPPHLPAHFYEDQIRTGHLYWQALHATLDHDLSTT